ncbi:MAG TPA: proton-conducting transporter membrane subunit [Chitinophagaceae bacterium]|nr:proton-conducting transporter membrane subunit [Chitinophagaceae bacterium]
MYSLITSLFVIPVLISLLLLFVHRSLAKPLVITASLFLSAVSVYLFINAEGVYYFGVPAYVNDIVAVADVMLLVFFGWIAIKRRSWIVGLMSLLQLGGLLYLLNNMPVHHSLQFMVDKLSLFMFLLINIISGIIAVYSLRYIDEEHCSLFRKKYFLSTIFWFIAVMNLVVSSDNLEYFFLFFELTTLASFLLIGFRKDEVSVKNSLTALWMNQVGGLAILAAIFFIHHNGYGEATFTNLLANVKAEGILLPLALLSMAALIKGAQMPFSKWLLGAMVAPTPVSALLHSSTMVKIAPFIILRLSPALKDTPVAYVIIALTGFVFIAAAIGALSQDNFKRILAHSTIALLALMIMMAAVAAPVTITASLILVLFHGISKSMLFLNAGILEKVFHLKQSSDMDKLGESGPFTALVITIGFMSLLLPPFGAFIGKWMSIESLGALATDKKILGALAMVAVAGGGAVLSLLYFKVMGVLIARTGTDDKIQFEKTGPYYAVTTYLLLGLLLATVISLPLLLNQYFAPVAGSLSGTPLTITTEGWTMFLGSIKLPLIPMLIAFLLLPVSVIAAMFVRFKNVDRAKEYMCGEKVSYSFSSFYFSTDRATPYFATAGILFFVALIIVALI